MFLFVYLFRSLLTNHYSGKVTFASHSGKSETHYSRITTKEGTELITLSNAVDAANNWWANVTKHVSDTINDTIANTNAAINETIENTNAAINNSIENTNAAINNIMNNNNSN